VIEQGFDLAKVTMNVNGLRTIPCECITLLELQLIFCFKTCLCQLPIKMSVWKLYNGCAMWGKQKIGKV
jgi:hypothetical protein